MRAMRSETWRTTRRLILTCSTILALCSLAARLPTATAQQTPADKLFLAFVRERAEHLRAQDVAPTSRAAWDERRAALRRDLELAWGGFPTEDCSLEPRVLGVLQRDGYRIERLVFQTLPGVWMTANAYVPAQPAPQRPAVLCVHGHWRLAKQEPVVQFRCQGLAKLGVFVLVVDAFGAGERAIGKGLGEYHGEMTAATLFPSGLTLAGIQVYENRRAVDYLQTRSEVDPARIAITGASGGGNQSMYAGTFDERHQAVIPVCSVGNYRAYLGAACCMCEVVPGALRFTDEGDVLGLAAPRALMVINATGDAPQFSVAEARKSLARARDIFGLHDRSDAVRHTIIESGHDYNQAMREAMYGWVLKHLAGVGDGSPIAEPKLTAEDPEQLRCYPGDSRPDDYVTLPRFAANRATEVLARLREQPFEVNARRAVLRDRLLGGLPQATPLRLVTDVTPEGTTRLRYESEPGLTLEAWFAPVRDARRTAVLLDVRPPSETLAGDLARKLFAARWNVLAPELRATGRTAVKGDAIGAAPDHNSAEWSLWIGRPLVGQWVWDASRAVAALDEFRRDTLTPDQRQPVVLVGSPDVGPLPMIAGALEERYARVACIDSLTTYVPIGPFRGQRLTWIVPGLLRDVGDVAELAALAGPERVVFAGGVGPHGERAERDEIARQFAAVPSASGIRLVERDQWLTALE